MEKLINVVRSMRHAQKEYFRTRSQQALRESKHLEAAVDRALLELESTQKRLFADETDTGAQ